MKPLPLAAKLLIAVTVVAATPYVALGVRDALDGRVPPEYLGLLFLAAFVLSVRPIRVQSNTELSASDVAVIAGIVLMPPGAVASMAAAARLANDILSGKRPLQMIRNAASVAVATGTAAALYTIFRAELALMVEPVAATIVAGVAAVLVLVFVDIAQIVLLQRALRNVNLDKVTRQWVNRTVRAQLLWSLAAVITVQVVLIEPWFLIPGIPLFLFGYLDIRARFAAERRARLLATLVEVGHSVGSSLDPVKVFREVFEQVRKAIDVDAFYVAIAIPERGTLSFRYLYDGGEEMEPEESPMAGTLGGLAVERDKPILLHDAERVRGRRVPRLRWRQPRVRGDDGHGLERCADAPEEQPRDREVPRGGDPDADPRRGRRSKERPEAPAPLRPRQRAAPTPSSRGQARRRALRDLEGAPRRVRRRARAHRCPRRLRCGGHPEHRPLPGARRRVPVDRLGPDGDDPSTGPLPRGPSAASRGGRARPGRTPAPATRRIALRA